MPAMNPSARHACPRCYHGLFVNSVDAGEGVRVLLACPEPYCDYVLLLADQEASTSAAWNWSEITWFRREAS